ncbi:hypothetical protein V8E55_008696 [Tylopilus felleus]
MANRTDFRLPGYTLHPLAERKCLLSLLAAYSKQWNPRNLEHPWYEPWGQILAALVAEHPAFSVAPQPYLWYDASLSFQPHTTPGPDYLMSTNDEELDDPVDGVGNDTLDSICTQSVSSHNDRTRIPDFAITRKVSFPRPENTSHFSHLSRRVTYVGFPLLAELKRPGHRSDDIGLSLDNVRFQMALARGQLSKQASHLFNMYPHQDSVILIAIAGFWWSYSIYSRQQMEDNPPLAGKANVDEDEEDDLQEVPDPSFDDQDGIHRNSAQEPSNSDDDEAAKSLQDQLRDYGFALRSLGDMHDEAKFHTILPEGELRLIDDGEWSDYLLYGTASSNQVLSLILDRLRDVVRYHYRGERG